MHPRLLLLSSLLRHLDPSPPPSSKAHAVALGELHLSLSLTNETPRQHQKLHQQKKTPQPAAPASADVVIQTPKVFPPNFVDPTVTWHVNERAIFRPAGYRAFKRAEALLNATAYPFVYGYVPTTGLKNTTNYTLVAVGAVGTAVNATATALNFTSPVAGLGNDLAQTINNAIKVRCPFLGAERGKKEKVTKRDKKKLTSKVRGSTSTPEKKSKQQTTNAVYNLTIGKAMNATVYKVGFGVFFVLFSGE